MPGPSFSVTNSEARTIRAIATRAVKTIQQLHRCGALDVHMTIAACHASGCPLRLEALLAADDFNFVHDVVGIYRHLDPSSGKLTDGFSPRFHQRRQRRAA